MNPTNVQATVQALITPANAPDWAVVDALDHAEMALGPYRAVQALACVEQVASEQDMPQLTRADLSELLAVLTGHMAGQIAAARALACERAKDATTH
jgi:uncharacterized protein (UPF0147 family)